MLCQPDSGETRILKQKSGLARSCKACPDTPSLKLETFSQFHRFHSFWVKIGDIELTKYYAPRVFEISQFLVKASDTTSLKLEQNEIHSIHTYIHIIMQQLV